MTRVCSGNAATHLLHLACTRHGSAQREKRANPSPGCLWRKLAVVTPKRAFEGNEVQELENNAGITRSVPDLRADAASWREIRHL